MNLDQLWSRRGLFMAGTQVVGGITLAAAFERYAQAQGSDAIDWRGLFSSMPKGGTGKVKALTGIAFANARTLAVGATVASGEQLRVSKGSKLVVSVQDGTLLTLGGDAVLDFSVSEHKTGLLNLIAGSLLTVMPTGNRYLVGGPVATIGVKGTVVYRQVFTESEMTALESSGSKMKMPGRGLRDYCCTCNGAVDYVRNKDKSFIVSDAAEHHHAFFLDNEDPKLLRKFQQINHTDQDIKAAIDLQDGPKHDATFLQLR
jgi:hypothetical protein